MDLFRRDIGDLFGLETPALLREFFRVCPIYKSELDEFERTSFDKMVDASAEKDIVEETNDISELLTT